MGPRKRESRVRVSDTVATMITTAVTSAAPYAPAIERSLTKLERWMVDHDYKGYEPFDGLMSFLRPLTLHTVFGERVLQQTVRQSPINLRPLFGVKPLRSTKGMGYIAAGYLKLFERGDNPAYRRKAVACLDWLIENKSPRYRAYSWANAFDYASRAGKIPRNESTIVWTSLIGQTFLDAYDVLGEPRYLDVAVSVCDWILGLPREHTPHGVCLSYVAYTGSYVHNSNMLGAAMLARTASLTGDTQALAVANAAMRYSCAGQLPDGAWYYGDAPKYRWIDSFHTGYNLDSLKRYLDACPDAGLEEHMERGYRYFKDHFFEDSGRPKYYHNRTHPIDIQCASQAVETLVGFAAIDPTSLDLALKVARWTIDNMQDETGYFYYRILPIKKVKIPMIHWGQATMFKALAHLVCAMSPSR
jgi:hypothetical protein